MRRLCLPLSSALDESMKPIALFLILFISSAYGLEKVNISESDICTTDRKCKKSTIQLYENNKTTNVELIEQSSNCQRNSNNKRHITCEMNYFLLMNGLIYSLGEFNQYRAHRNLASSELGNFNLKYLASNWTIAGISNSSYQAIYRDEYHLTNNTVCIKRKFLDPYVGEYQNCTGIKEDFQIISPVGLKAGFITMEEAIHLVCKQYNEPVVTCSSDSQYMPNRFKAARTSIGNLIYYIAVRKSRYPQGSGYTGKQGDYLIYTVNPQSKNITYVETLPDRPGINW
jgi:hypothetical protein